MRHWIALACLVATLDYGRTYSYAAGGWVVATTPGVELCMGRFSLGASWSAAKDYFANDLSLNYSHDLTSRLSWSASASWGVQRGYVPDYLGSTGLRWRIR